MSFFGSLFGTDASSAANAAASDTYKKQKKATAAYDAFGNQYASGMQGLSQKFQPYEQGGNQAFQQLLGGLGLSGPEAGAAFTQAYHNLPGYQSGLDTGINAANASSNAGHMGQSGRAMKDLYRFGSNYEDQRSGDYLSRLAGLAQTGQQATGQEVATAGQGLNGQLQQRGTSYGGQMQSAGTIGQGMVAGANAEQSALTNLMGLGAYGIGSVLGGPMGGQIGTSLFGMKPPATTPYQNTFMGPR